MPSAARASRISSPSGGEEGKKNGTKKTSKQVVGQKCFRSDEKKEGSLLTLEKFFLSLRATPGPNGTAPPTTCDIISSLHCSISKCPVASSEIASVSEIASAISIATVSKIAASSKVSYC